MGISPMADPLLQVLRDPMGITSFSPTDWNEVLRRARLGRLVAKLSYLIESRGLLERVPDKVRDQLVAGRAVSRQHRRIIKWEMNRIHRALAGVDTDIVLLKGAAYAACGLPMARGRLMSDVDIMVPKEKIGDVEQALLGHGWEQVKLDPYDQRYYRLWMHELPPLRHAKRRSVVDVHHTILPESGRLHPDPKALLDSAQCLEGGTFKVLAPCDMVLHCAAHLFQDGDFQNSLRDLIDLDGLFRDFHHRAGFWDQLVDRAIGLDLHRPLFYALRYASRILQTPIPEAVFRDALVGRPVWPTVWMMDRLVGRAICIPRSSRGMWGSAAARWLLYIRSHWLRMPPYLLAKHLMYKALKEWFSYSGKKK